MKRTFFTLFAFSLSLFLSQCSEPPTHSEGLDNSSQAIKIAIAIPPGYDKKIAHAYVYVTADSMRPIEQKLSISNSSITGIVQNIPAGDNRHFEVYVYGPGNTLLYYGDTYASIYSGLETYLKIVLRQPGGTAVIDGYIEGYEPPSDTIPAPATPYIESYSLYISEPARIHNLNLATDGSNYPDSLYYIWEVLRGDSIDTVFNCYVRGLVLQLEDPEDGFYQVDVKAQAMNDTSFMSAPSSPLFFIIKDGLIVDSVQIPDRIPPQIYLNGDSTITLLRGSTYIEYGATAFDNVDGTLTDSIHVFGEVNINVIGSYLKKYVVYDQAGNSAVTIRKIIVIERSGIDTIPPVLTLLGETNIILAPNEIFVEPGYKAVDNVDGDLTSKVVFDTIVDSSNITIIKYSVKDMVGNRSDAFRTISTETSVPTPNKPKLISTKTIDTIPPAFELTFQTSAIKIPKGGKVSYEWAIFDTTLHSEWIVITATNKLTNTFNSERVFTLKVRARSVQNPASVSFYSDRIQLSTVGGIVR